MGVESILAPFMQEADLCIAALGTNARTCRVADLGWRLGRVYFLAFLNPSRGTTGPSPYRQVGRSCHRR